MKKILGLLLLSSSLGFANGFKIQEQSINGTALSSAYVAGARGADASYYNPANMGFSNDWGENKSEFELATSLITIPGFKFDVPTTNQGLYSETTLKFSSGTQTGINIGKTFIPALEDLSKPIKLYHTSPDVQVVGGSTGDTNFILPKLFYKSRTHNGFTFGASFVAPSGLAMNWVGKGGEFLQDVFIMMIEFAPSVSYTIGDRFSIGFAPRILYAMGSFNNVVYVPLDKKKLGISLDPSQIGNLSNDEVAGLIPQSIKDQVGPLLKFASFFMPSLKNSDGTINWTALMSGVESETTNLFGTAQVYQKSDGKALSAGYRVAASLRVFDNGMLSVVYNSPVKLNMQGSLSATTYIGGAIGDVLTTGDLNIAVTMPEILTLAYAENFFKNHLRIEGVYERTFWSRGSKFLVTPDFENATYKGLSGMVANTNVFNSDTLKGMVGLADFAGVMNMGAGWRDTNTYRLGVTYMGKSLRLMGSLAYDQAPSPQDKIGIPDSDGYMVGAGVKYNFRGFDLGVAYSVTFKDNRRSMYQSDGLGQLKIATMSLGYRW
ncbi:hypothetical protein BKH42_02560 [Helicobacter sp. 13S00482-2]|uniref:OmpP1/FadL family transporter n=1 Tax=Helicobacter sp. 13S00482-2 TaxID=1476200 RepID=UPI000BA799DC|nr:outer membrane protein transport protein [Helicobacter sp. 13S00482-2]PAF54112.1 hypothetical protein BKH42_02560 [Helicobacter sp. 13S00482-2]